VVVKMSGNRTSGESLFKLKPFLLAEFTLHLTRKFSSPRSRVFVPYLLYVFLGRERERVAAFERLTFIQTSLYSTCTTALLLFNLSLFVYTLIFTSGLYELHSASLR
jgi:hypothetical protein